MKLKKKIYEVKQIKYMTRLNFNEISLQEKVYKLGIT